MSFWDLDFICPNEYLMRRKVGVQDKPFFEMNIPFQILLLFQIFFPESVLFRLVCIRLCYKFKHFQILFFYYFTVTIRINKLIFQGRIEAKIVVVVLYHVQCRFIKYFCTFPFFYFFQLSFFFSCQTRFLPPGGVKYLLSQLRIFS